MDAADVIEVILGRGPCFGTCPEFRFAASRHAGYHYEGHGHVEPLGRRTGGLPGTLFDWLAGACVELRVLELDDVYPCDFEDAPTMILTVRHAGGVKVVRDEGGDSGPVRLWALAALVEVVMRRALELSDRWRGKWGRAATRPVPRRESGDASGPPPNSLPGRAARGAFVEGGESGTPPA